MFRRMSEERVTLEFLSKQLERVIAEQNSTRDDLRVPYDHRAASRRNP